MGDKAKDEGSETLRVLTARTDFGVFDYTQTPLEHFVENLANEFKVKLSVLTPVQKPTYPGNQGLEVLALQREGEDEIDGKGHHKGKTVKVSFNYLRYPSEQTNESITRGFVPGDTDYLKKNAVRLYIIDEEPRAEYAILTIGLDTAVVEVCGEECRGRFRLGRIRDIINKTAMDGKYYDAQWNATVNQFVEIPFTGSAPHGASRGHPYGDRERLFATVRNFFTNKG